MKNKKKYFSISFLFVFACILFPTHFLHEIFAHHEDTLCEVVHFSDQTQLENKHQHCDQFNTNSQLFEETEFVVFDAPTYEIGSVNLQNQREDFLTGSQNRLPSRAPPMF